MRAVVIRDRRPAVEGVPDPVRRPGEALIRVTLAGVCGTDLEIFRGYMGFRGIPGHEFVGVVVESSDPGWRERRVVGEINLPCRVCGSCRDGTGSHCPDRTVLGILGKDGAFAEYLTLPERNLHPVPDEVPDRAAVFCEPLAAAYEIPEQLEMTDSDRVLLIGDGRLGQLIARVLVKLGCAPVVLGRHRDKLESMERIGCETLAAPTRPDGDFDVVVEASGDPGALETALQAVRPRGTIVLKSTYHGTVGLDLSGVVVNEVRLVGSRCGPFGPALRHLAGDPGETECLVTAEYGLAEAAAAFERAADPSALKVLIRP